MQPVIVGTNTARLAVKAASGKMVTVATVDQSGNVGQSAALRLPR
jgi:hypothetical protein